MEEAVKRCYAFIVAVYKEVEALQNITEPKAKAVAQMKINLSEYLIHIWPNRAALDADLKAIEAAYETGAIE